MDSYIHLLIVRGLWTLKRKPVHWISTSAILILGAPDEQSFSKGTPPGKESQHTTRFLWVAIILTNSKPAEDWRDRYFPKYQRKIYDVLEEVVSEGW